MDPEHPSPDCAPTPSSWRADEDPSALIRADRLALLGTLVASVAHEVNNPITYVLGNLGELERLGEAFREVVSGYRQMVGKSPDAAERIAQIEAKLTQTGGLETMDEILSDALEGAERIRDLCRDLLAPSRDDRPGCGQAIDVHPLIDWSLRLVRSQVEGIAQIERLDGATRIACGDRTQLGQVILNLLTNAIDACAEAGTPGRIRIETRDVEEGIEISVRDSGGGVPETIRDRIFEAFFTTKAADGGSGLGLYISRGIVERHGGRLEFLASPSGGTTFRVFLPGHSVDGLTG